MTRNFRSDKEKPKKKSDLKAFLKKRSFIYIGLLVLFLMFLIPDLTSQSDLENKLANHLEGEPKQAVDLLKSYKGSNEKGLSIIEALSRQIDNSYPSEKILEHQETQVNFDAILKEEQNGHMIFEVNFSFDTYKENLEYVWNVNIITGEIQAVNSNARKILDIVDFYN